MITEFEHLIITTAWACLDKRARVLIEHYLMVLHSVIISVDIAGRLHFYRLHLWVLPREDYIDLIITIEVIFSSARIHVIVVHGLVWGAVILHWLSFSQIGFLTGLWVTFEVPICSIHDSPLVGFDNVASGWVGHDRFSILHLVWGAHELLYGFKRKRLSLDTTLAGQINSGILVFRNWRHIDVR